MAIAKRSASPFSHQPKGDKTLKIIRYLCTFLMLCSLSFGQMNNNYRDQITDSLMSTYSLCGLGVAASTCWVPFPNAPALSNVSVGADLDLWGIRAGSTTVIHYNPVTTAWDTVTAVPGGAKKLSVAGSSMVYALSINEGIYQYVNSSWVLVPLQGHTFRDLSVGVDGDLWAIGDATYGCGYKVFHWDTSTLAWQFTNLGLSQLSVRYAQEVWGVCSSIASPNNNVFGHPLGERY